MGKYNFTTKLKTDDFDVQIDETALYGYFEDCGRNDEEECAGGLWFEVLPSLSGYRKLALCDYDGVFELPKQVADALRDAGYDVSYLD
jgi:hypothetical protein